MKVVVFRMFVALFMVIAISLMLLTIASFRRPVRLSEGIFTDSGFWSYPRYNLSLDTFVNGKDASKTIEVSGLPSCKMLLGLRLVEDRLDVGPLRKHDELKSKFELDKIVIRVRIVDGSGNEVYTSTSPLSDWSLSSSTTETYFWHERFSFKLNSWKEYSISIRLQNKNEKVDLPRLAAFIRGGGSELP